MVTHATVKGQVVIPAVMRRQLGIQGGTRLQVEVDGTAQRIILTPVTPAFIRSLRGKLKGAGLLKALEAERVRERARED